MEGLWTLGCYIYTVSRMTACLLDDGKTSNNVNQYVETDAGERLLACVLHKIKLLTSFPVRKRTLPGRNLTHFVRMTSVVVRCMRRLP